VKTVSTYRSRLLLKMGLHNSAELLHYAFQHQLVEPQAGRPGVGPLALK
jgi:DNA-binding NarL/FixJ family response regulator